jgi:WD40 repeat protein
MKKTYQGLAVLFVGLVLLAVACSRSGENDTRDHAIQDDSTKPFQSAIKGKLLAECLDHSDCVSGVAVSPDGKLAVSSSWDETLRFWSVPDGKLIRTIRAKKPPRDSGCTGPPHFSGDGKTVAALVRSTEEKSVKLCFWDAATGKQLPRSVAIEGRGEWALSPDEERMARVIDEDCVRVWETREGKIVREFRFRKEELVVPWTLSFSPDGNYLAVGLAGRPLPGLPPSGSPPPPSVSSKVRLWDLRSGELVFASEILPLSREARWVKRPDSALEPVPEKQPFEARAVAFSPDGTRLAAGGTDYPQYTSIWVWDLPSRKLVQKLRVGEPFVSSIAFSPDGHMVACGTGSDPEIQIWNVTSAKRLGSLEKHTGTVTAVAWAKDGRSLVSCGQDSRVLIWRLKPR